MISVIRTLVFLSCVYAVESLTIRHTIPEQTSTTTELDNGCKPEACETAKCIDPVTINCCPECPNGENCLIEGQKVSFNEPLVFPDGRICYCVQESTFRCEDSSSSPPPYEIVYDDVILFTSTSPEPDCRNSPKPENDPCAHCECNLISGTWKWACYWQDCMVPACFDAYRPPGQCCSVCPNGPNCGVDGTIIPLGEFREVNGEMCFCHQGGYRQDVTCQPFSTTTKEIAWTTEETTREITTLTTPGQDCRFTTKPENGPCFDCTCELNSGQYKWNCFWFDCTIPPCVDAFRAPGKCCYECPNGPNCQVNGVIIPEGDVRPTDSGVCYCLRGGFHQEVNCEPLSTLPPTTTPFDGCAEELKPKDKCSFCECNSWSGTREWLCIQATCPEPPCVDAVYDECCPRCPNGPNCGIDGLIIPYGQERLTSDGQVCFCGGSSPYRQRNLELTCHPITTTPDPNCYVGGVLIPEGEIRETDSGMCYCLRGGSNPEINCEPLSTLPPTTPFNGCAPENKPYDKCGFCECSEWTGWTWQCFHPTCSEPPCVDPDYSECCPTCPNGPNCEVDGIVIPHGESREIPNGQSCFCGGIDTYRKGNLEIICQPFSTTPDSAYCDVDGVLIGIGEFHEKDNGALCYCDASLVANCNFSVHTTPTPWTTTPEGCDPNLKPAEKSCTICECSENKWICVAAACLPTLCVDSYKPAGECCSVCPNGPNCREGGVIIPLNTILPVNGSAECQCVQNNPWEPPVAVCRSISTTTTAKLIFITKGPTPKPSPTKPTTKTTKKPTTKTTTKPTTKSTTKPTTKSTTKPTAKSTTKPTTKTTTKPTTKTTTKPTTKTTTKPTTKTTTQTTTKSTTKPTAKPITKKPVV
ncbi:kielin/chordin-like protein [Biomphalaria pfeifferi]|uniref:Kielin/chordin-like protein n=1 Tax=Biomphalaria pfeifferi TaxID=112525 RepID=A0AAD8FKZ4_BIOPF|nr:kielin/chordin-like protein [Biomphalaria pfeifferi]